MNRLLFILGCVLVLAVVVIHVEAEREAFWEALSRSARASVVSRNGQRRASGGRTSRRRTTTPSPLVDEGEEEVLVRAAQTRRAKVAEEEDMKIGYSGTVMNGKSSYILKFNEGVPVYGAGEPYYFSYTHNFPIATSDFPNLVNSHNLPHKYKFSGKLDVTHLLE